MKYFLLEIIFLNLCSNGLGYDLFQGLLAQLRPCFDYIHDDGCHTSLSQVYTPKRKGVNTNPPDTKFYLFTNKNPGKAEPLHKCGGKLSTNSDFDPQADTVIVVHGWLDGVCRSSWMREYVAQFFTRGSYNVILTDWTWGNSFDFAGSAANTVVVGEEMAFLTRNIMNQTGVNGDKFHLIGHSFGTFIISDAAKIILRKNKKNKIRRLTHLDPAIAPYVDANPEKRLSYKNAKFVDVIHSDGGNCFPLNFGKMTPVGHADFYPNGGSIQLSSFSYALTSILKGDLVSGFASLLYPPLGFHLQSIQFFKVSINPNSDPYVGVKCDSYDAFQSGACKRCCQNDPSNCAVAGMDAESHFPFKSQPRQPRKYFFDTSNFCPYKENYNFSINKDCTLNKTN